MVELWETSLSSKQVSLSFSDPEVKFKGEGKKGFRRPGTLLSTAKFSNENN